MIGATPVFLQTSLFSGPFPTAREVLINLTNVAYYYDTSDAPSHPGIGTAVSYGFKVVIFRWPFCGASSTPS